MKHQIFGLLTSTDYDILVFVDKFKETIKENSN